LLGAWVKHAPSRNLTRRPALLAPPGEVHRVAGAMFTISYSIAVITPIFSGLAWDVTGVPAMAFLSIGACALMLIIVAPTIRFAAPPA